MGNLFKYLKQTIGNNPTAKSKNSVKLFFEKGNEDYNMFLDIFTCPVCNTPEMNYDEYTVREYFHIKLHLRRIALYMIEFNEYPTSIPEELNYWKFPDYPSPRLEYYVKCGKVYPIDK